MPGFWRETADGAEIFVRLTPRAASDRLSGIGETADGKIHLKAQVRAVPEKGAANAALEKLVAKRLGVPKGAVSVVSGQTSRLKTLRIVGRTIEPHLALLARIATEAE